MHSKKNENLNLAQGKVDFNLTSLDKLLTFTENVNNIYAEIKALQRSISLLKQDLPKIVRNELTRLNGGKDLNIVK